MEINPKNAHNKIKYHFASKIEGQKLYSENTDYFNNMNQADIEWRIKKKGATIEELKAFGQTCVLEFTQQEKELIKNSIEYIENVIKTNDFNLPFPEEGIIFIKTSMLEEGSASGYTHKNQIYLGEDDFPHFAFLLSEEKRQKMLSKFNELISHEIFHCLTRNSPKFRKIMYSLIGFNILDHDLNFPPEIKNKILINPDVDHFDNYKEFTIEGVNRKCELIIIYTKTYPEVEAEGVKEDLFFFHMSTVLVPIDTLDTYYPIENVPNFFQKVGANTPYVIAPEEILADNFKLIIAKSNFNFYPNQGILKNMMTALKEWDK